MSLGRAGVEPGEGLRADAATLQGALLLPVNRAGRRTREHTKYAVLQQMVRPRAPRAALPPATRPPSAHLCRLRGAGQGDSTYGAVSVNATRETVEY